PRIQPHHAMFDRVRDAAADLVVVSAARAPDGRRPLIVRLYGAGHRCRAHCRPPERVAGDPGCLCPPVVAQEYRATPPGVPGLRRDFSGIPAGQPAILSRWTRAFASAAIASTREPDGCGPARKKCA